MKPSIIKKIVLVLALALVAGVAVFASGIDIDSGMSLIAAAVPAGVIIGNFDLKKLKIPQEEYRTLKAKHKRLYVINISIEEGEDYQFIVCRPSRSLLSAVTAAGDDTDKINDLVIKNMVLAGDLDAIDDGLVYSGLMRETGKLMKMAKGFLMKA